MPPTGTRRRRPRASSNRRLARGGSDSRPGRIRAYRRNGGTPVLDPAKVTGKIVVCTRGTNARVDKSLAVKQAGGVGMILADNGAGVTADFHSVPSVHINLADGNVKAAAVVGIPDSDWGEVPVGFVILKPGERGDADELTQFCRARLASYKVPRTWRFVTQFPQTASGKIQKFKLRDDYLGDDA